MSKITEYMKGKRSEEKKDTGGPQVNGRNQNDYPAIERPCFAHGCPELGTITESLTPSSGSVWFCRHHYTDRHTPKAWPEITHRLLQRPVVPIPVEPEYTGKRTPEVASKYLYEIKSILSPAGPGLIAGTFRHIGGRVDIDPKEWAKILRVRHESGEDLSIAQIDAYKQALGLGAGLGLLAMAHDNVGDLMPYQPELYDKPHFDGATYDSLQDHERLTSQLARVLDCMKDGHWRTLTAIADSTGDPESSVSARLRDLRKERFGAMQLERRRIAKGRGRYEYRLHRAS